MKYLPLFLCFTQGKGQLKEGVGSNFEMKVFLILNLCWREKLLGMVMGDREAHTQKKEDNELTGVVAGRL